MCIVQYVFICYRSVPTQQRERMAVDPVETVITAVRAPDDGCQHMKHVELPTKI